MSDIPGLIAPGQGPNGRELMVAWKKVYFSIMTLTTGDRATAVKLETLKNYIMEAYGLLTELFPE